MEPNILKKKWALMNYRNIPSCKICGQHFDNVFEAIDHMTDDQNEPPFDPRLILPGGYQLMIGSLLKTIFLSAGRNQKVKDIVQHTYATLYAAETSPRKMKKFIEDLIVNEEMSTFDYEIEDFFDNYKGDKDDTN